MINDEIIVKSDDSKILIAKYPYAPIENPKLAKFILEQGDVQNKFTNVKAQMTDWLITNSEIENLKEWIMKNFLSMKISNSSCDFYFESLWGNVLRKDDFVIPHNHLPGFVSFVYYVKCSEYSSPLHFCTSGLEITPEEGMLFIFPSHLNHYVPPQKFIDERISISGNLYFSRIGNKKIVIS